MHAKPAQTTNVTHFRKYLSIYIDHVRYGDQYVRINRKGRDAVYLISQADFDLLWSKQDALMYGPRDPETGKLPARGFWFHLLDILKTERKRRG